MCENTCLSVFVFLFSPPCSLKAIGVLEEAKQLRRAERSFILRSRAETSELRYARLIHFASQYMLKTASWSRLPLKNANLPTPARGASHHGEAPDCAQSHLTWGNFARDCRWDARGGRRLGPRWSPPLPPPADKAALLRRAGATLLKRYRRPACKKIHLLPVR